MSKRRIPLTKFPELLKNPPPNLDIMLYDKKKKEPHLGDKNVKKTRMDRIEESITKLSEQMNSRFDKFEKDVNSRFDRIDARLDYIVKANNLKDNK